MGFPTKSEKIKSDTSCRRRLLKVVLAVVAALLFLWNFKSSTSNVSSVTSDDGSSPIVRKSLVTKELHLANNNIINPSLLSYKAPLRLQSEPSQIKVPLPIFVLSLPKSGTTSVLRYFQCGHQPTAHTFGLMKTTDENGRVIQKQMRLGHCARLNHKANRPLLQDCGNYTVFSDMGLPARYGKCFYPSLHGLDNLATHYPHATILLVVRQPLAWYHSAKAWGRLLGKWMHHCDGFPSVSASTVDEFVAFYKDHAARIQTWCSDHPTLTCVTVSLESSETAAILQDRFGISASCWGTCQPSAANCSYDTNSDTATVVQG